MASLAWKLNRLRAMDAGEIAHRAWRATQARWQSTGLGVRARAPAPTARFGAPWIASWPSGLDADAWRAAAERLLAGRWDVFAATDLDLGFPPQWNRDPSSGKIVPLTFGKRLEYRDIPRVGDIRQVWEINRHGELALLAQSYALTGDARHARACATLLQSWFEQCPVGRGANWVSALEAAVRLNNWAFAWHLLGGAESPLFADAAGADLRRQWLDGVYHHCAFIDGYLSRHSSANNHLIGELAGLYIATLTWPCWRESASWRARARRELEREALAQNAPDGGNREQAFYYHHEVLEWLMLAGVWARANGETFSSAYWERVEAMLAFLMAIMDVAGHVPMVGDADDAHIVRFDPSGAEDPYRALLALGAVWFERADFAGKADALGAKARWLLGDVAVQRFQRLRAARVTPTPRRAFPDTGYYLLGADFDTEAEVRILADAGPLGYLSIAAHGHADALAFTLNVGGHEVLIDPGTYTYQGDIDWREYFRGTAAHNTVTVDGQNQSRSGGRFLWLDHGNARALDFQVEAHRQSLSAEHDGYRRLRDPVVHRRDWAYFPERRVLELTDRFFCRRAHDLVWHWHFAESVDVAARADTVIARVPGWRIALIAPEGCDTPQLWRGATDPPAGWVSRRFGDKAPSTTVTWRARLLGDDPWVTRIHITRDVAGAHG